VSKAAHGGDLAKHPRVHVSGRKLGIIKHLDDYGSSALTKVMLPIEEAAKKRAVVPTCASGCFALDDRPHQVKRG
jgi:hypothetical protein